MVKIISIVIPIYNEKNNVFPLYQELISIWQKLSDRYQLEIVYVNDGSSDGSAQELDRLSQQDARVKSLEFSRNFGKEAAISAGIRGAQGEAIIIMDGDLQHPPAMIPQFINKWEAGAEVVVGVRKKSAKIPLLRRLGSYFYYKISNAISDSKTIPYASDYRLIDRQVSREFIRFTEKNRLARGLIDWLGFKKEYVYFDSPERKNDKPSYPLHKLIKLALISFTSNSLMPLKLAGYLGIACIIVFGFTGIYLIVDRYILHDPFGFNFTNLAIIVVFIGGLVGIILSCLGLIGIYIGNIQTEISNRPLFVVRNKKNID
ncbi:MAG: glycosyltransferase family 2 protein [Patescibacteria group bacterium]|nr:glycosyltransferase family 2 protein [Patescibacteria group bacterium]